MCGSMRMPSLGKTVKAETGSSSLMSAAQRASGRYGGSGVVMPKRLAMSTTVLMPTFSASFTAGTLREPASARRSVIVASNLSSELCGAWGWPPLNAHRILAQFLDGQLRQVTHFQEIAGFFTASPREIVGGKNSAVRPDFDDRISFAHGEDKSGNVASLLDRVAPIVVFVSIELAKIVAQHIRQIPFPPVAPLVGVQTIAQRLVREALHVDVQRGVDAQSALVDGFRAVRGFKILANVLEEIWREVVMRILNVQTERRIPGGGFFRRRDLPLVFHAMDHQIAAAKSGFRIRER